MNQLPEYVINLDDYEKGDQIGEGGSGLVFIYQNKHTNKLYAGKIVNVSDEKKFLREIQAYLLDHPAILKLAGFKSNNPSIILTEYMVNGSLDKKIKKNLLTPTQKQIILYGTAKGLEFLHYNNIIHRDIKPANILLDENLYPKITDFGLSKFTDDIFCHKQSMVCGTQKYLAPEVITGKYNCTADILSFGIVMYEVITSDYNTDIRDQSCNIENPLLPSSYKQLISKCLDYHSANRPRINEITTFLLEHPLEGVDEQEFRSYASMLDQYSPDDTNAMQKDPYQLAMHFIQEKNMIKAAKSMKISADMGNSDAQYQYAMMLLDGNGVAQNIRDGIKYLKMAADENNNIDAQFELALIYLDICEGKTKYEDYLENDDYEEDNDDNHYIKEAAKYMKLAADAGNSKAQFNFSLMLEGGHGIAEDDKESFQYLKMAAINENPNNDALIKFGDKCLLINDTLSAEKYYQTAADKMNSPAGQYKYGKLLLQRKESKKSESSKKAAEYIRMAADNDDESNEFQASAQNLYGVCLHEGIGVKKNLREAAQYFEKSSSKNNAQAIFNLGLELERKKLSEIEQKTKKLSQTQGNPNTNTSPTSSPVPFSKSQSAVLKSRSSAPISISTSQILNEKDQKKLFEIAQNYFKKSADLDCFEAADYYASAICDDNIREAEEYFTKAATKGNIDHAQYMLANLYYDIKDTKNGKYFLKMAAEQKYAPAQFLLAQQSEKNNKLKEALKLYQMAADQDFNQEKNRNIEILTANQDSNQDRIRKDAILAALENLTYLLINGKPEIMNIELAKKYAEKGKEFGNIPCAIEYAKLTNNITEIKEIADSHHDKNAQFEYAKLVKIPENSDECIEYLTMAADQHHNEACMTLVYLYERLILFKTKLPNFKRDMKKSKFYCQIAADNCYPPALTKLGLDYINGIGFKKDVEKSKNYLKKAIDYGNDPKALLNYADIIMKERAKNSAATNNNNNNNNDSLYKEAFNYYKEAAKQGLPEAQFRYACLILEVLEKKELNDINTDLDDSQSEEITEDENINYDTAEKNLKSAAKADYPPAIYKYSVFLLDIKKCTRKGMDFMKKAADLGNDEAKFKYGKMMFDGYNFKNRKGDYTFKIDKNVGLKYIKEAADNKFKAAEDFIEAYNGKSDNSKQKVMPKINVRNKK